MNLADYSRLDATALAECIRDKEISAAEAQQCAREAAAALNPRINAVIELFDAPLTHDAKGPFGGVPFLIKDLVLHAEGVRSQAGSRLFGDGVVAAADSALMARFRRAGFATLGRTHTPEFGFNATTESALGGATRNPWNLAHSSGGSSGGSAAAVAAGIVPIAHANDGGGSIRVPAAACGLVGLKPSRGRVSAGPDYGQPLMGLGIEGVVCRTVRDAAAALDAIHGNEPGDPFLMQAPAQSYARAIQSLPRKLRIAVSTQFPGTQPSAQPCVEAVEATARTLAGLGHAVEWATPAYTHEAFLSATRTFWSSFLAAGVAGMAQALQIPLDKALDQVQACTRVTAEYGLGLRALDLELALMQMNAVSREVAPFFARYDILLSPTMRTPPVPLGYLDQDDASRDARGFFDHLFDYATCTPLANLTGQPAISLPLAMAGDLPIGVHCMAPMGDEATLLQLAAQLEQAMPWAARRPAVHAATL
ncbi:amidase [Acidovorax cavernicola]|uniref:Amidase n=1 Tax=Acidovorax cavernicola TaxID=1675792 RepID=A0A9X8GTG5_9BURK|nr:amidase family protein [Acidovorax cavernicola]RIX76413.1 amidase [Acidovorax cavernicola]